MQERQLKEEIWLQVKQDEWHCVHIPLLLKKFDKQVSWHFFSIIYVVKYLEYNFNFILIFFYILSL